MYKFILFIFFSVLLTLNVSFADEGIDKQCYEDWCFQRSSIIDNQYYISTINDDDTVFAFVFTSDIWFAQIGIPDKTNSSTHTDHRESPSINIEIEVSIDQGHVSKTSGEIFSIENGWFIQLDLSKLNFIEDWPKGNTLHLKLENNLYFNFSLKGFATALNKAMQAKKIDSLIKDIYRSK